jgi:predicted RNA-binding protein with PUA domain
MIKFQASTKIQGTKKLLGREKLLGVDRGGVEPQEQGDNLLPAPAGLGPRIHCSSISNMLIKTKNSLVGALGIDRADRSRLSPMSRLYLNPSDVVNSLT